MAFDWWEVPPLMRPCRAWPIMRAEGFAPIYTAPEGRTIVALKMLQPERGAVLVRLDNGEEVDVEFMRPIYAQVQ